MMGVSWITQSDLLRINNVMVVDVGGLRKIKKMAMNALTKPAHDYFFPAIIYGEFVVLRAIGAVPVVKADVETVEVLRAAGGDVGHELLRRLAGLLGRDHDRRAVRVVGADEMHLVALHALEAHPDVGLDVFDQMAEVDGAVGVGQGGVFIDGCRWRNTEHNTK